jgi:hypothetical protein
MTKKRMVQLIKLWKFKELILLTVLLLPLRQYLVTRIHSDFWFAVSVSMNKITLFLVKLLDHICGAIILFWVIIITAKITAKFYESFLEKLKKNK